MPSRPNLGDPRAAEVGVEAPSLPEIPFALAGERVGEREAQAQRGVSTHGFEEVMRMVRESRATIYTIGISNADES